MQTYTDPNEAYSAIDNSLRERVLADDELALSLSALNDDDLADVKTQWQAKQRAEVQIDTGRTTEERYVTGGRGMAKIKPQAITRPLEAPEVEADWQALSSGQIGLEDLTAEEAKRLRGIAEKQDPELVHFLETDPAYLKEYYRAAEEYKEWIQKDGFYDTSLEDRDRGFMPEGIRKFVGAALTPGFAVQQWAQRSKRVEFGNPDGVDAAEIRKRAEEAVIADMLPQIMGVKTFDDGKELTVGEKLGGAAGTLASYVVATPNKLVFDAGMKGGAKLAMQAGLEGWKKRMLTFAAGGMAGGVKHTLESPLPSSEADSVADFTKRLALNTTTEAAGAAAFGEALHYGLAGLGYAWSKSLGRDTPLMKTVQKGDAQQFTDHFFKVAQRVENGTANAAERASFNSFSEWAARQKVDLEALKRGELGMEWRKLVPREWTENIPILRNALPDSVERVRPQATTPPRVMIPESSRPTGEVPGMPKQAAPIEPLALPGQTAPSSTAAAGVIPAVARLGDLPSQPSPVTQGTPTPDIPTAGGDNSVLLSDPLVKPEASSTPINTLSSDFTAPVLNGINSNANISIDGTPSESSTVQSAIDTARASLPEPSHSDFQRYALQLNEMTEFAQALGNGKYPRILEQVLRNPNVRGVFRSVEGNKNSGRIELKDTTFELLTESEIAEAKASAYDALYESWLGESEAIGNAGVTPPTKEVFGFVLKSDPLLQGRLKLMEKEVLGETRREVAPTREPYQALTTLAHEIGHWIDFLPDGTMSRGNVLGRIASVSRHYKKMLPASPNSENTTDLISPKERQRMKREALKQVAGDKLAASLRYQELLELERKAKGLIKFEDVRDELLGLTTWWRLKDNSAALTDYHRKPEELYADAFSVLINAPAELKKRAPIFYSSFEAYLSRKGEAANAYESLQKSIIEGSSQTAQVKRLRESLSKESALLTPRAAKHRGSELWDGFTSMFVREFQPLYRRSKRGGRETLKQTQEAVTNWLYRATAHELYLTQLNNEVLKPLSDTGVDMLEFDEFMFHLHLTENRINIANPLGWTAKTSIERLADIEAKQPIRYAAMKAAQSSWWDLRKRMVIEPLRKSGIFNDELMNHIEEQAFYTPFRKNSQLQNPKADSIENMLMHHFGKDMGLRIAKQVGQLGEIKSPTNSLMATDLKLMDLVKRNEAKQKVVEIMKMTDPKFINEAETQRVRVRGRWQEEPIDVENARIATIYTMKRGEVQGYYVPKAIAVPFNKEMNVNSAWLAAALYRVNSFQKSLFTQLNPGFWPIALVRDVMTRYRKMPSAAKDRWRDFAPIGLAKDALAIAEAFPSAWRSVKGEIDTDAQAALERGMVISRRETVGHGNTFKGADIERALLEFDKDPRNYFTKRQGAEKQIAKALNFWLSIGQAFERAPKIATMKYLDENFSEWSEPQKRNFVRQHGGSPDFLQRGSAAHYLDLFMLFHNPAREGWMSEADAAISDPKGYLSRTAQMVLPSLAFKLAGLGLLGAGGLKLLSMMMPWLHDEGELEEMFQSIPHYDMVNYDVIPLMWADRDSKKVLYSRLPKDETSRLILGSLMQPALEGGSAKEILSYAGGNTPGPNPILGVLQDWWTFGVNEQNPYDSFMQRNVVDPTKFKAGQGTEDLLWSSWNKLGGSIIKRVQPEQISLTPETQIENFLDLPVVENVIGRWFKVSNAGQRQRIVNDGRVIEAGQHAAEETLLARDIVEVIVNGGELSEATYEAMLYSPKVSEKVNRYLNSTLKRALGPEIEAIEGLQTSEEKEAAAALLAE